MDIHIGWQVQGQQDDRLADTHVYVYTCVIATMLTYLSYRAYHICSIVYTMICMEVIACIRSVGIMSAGRHVDMYTLIYKGLFIYSVH